MRQLGSAAFAAYLGLSILAFGVVGSPALLFGERQTRGVIKCWVRTVFWALKVFCGVTHRVDHPENLPQEGAIVAVNHQSMWETIAFFAMLPQPVMILKKELTRVPIFGLWAMRAGSIAVDRKGGAKALRRMRDAAARRIAEGCQVVVFPEGTRTPPGEIAPYHPGVAGIYAAASAPCTPAAHDSGRYWRHPGIMKTPGEITVRILEPLEPGLDRKQFLRELQNRIDGARPDLAAPTERKGSPDD